MGIQVLCVMAAAVVGVVDRPAPKKDAPKTEAKKFEGTWRVVMLESRGHQFPEERPRQLQYQVVIHGEEFAMLARGRKRTMHFKVDPAARPRAMDLVAVDGPTKGKTIQAIYLLDGDTLKICQAPPGSSRPAEFSTQGQNRQSIMVLKREKP